MGKLELEAYQIDMTDEESRKAVMDLLASRGSTLDLDFVLKNQFILGNSFDDLWFQDAALPAVFQKEIQYFYKYFEGPRQLPVADHLLCSQSNLNDIHLIVHMPDMSDIDALRATKQFRKMSQTN